MHAPAEREERDREPMDEDRAEDHERDDRLDRRGEQLMLAPRRIGWLRQLLGSKGRDIDRTWISFSFIDTEHGGTIATGKLRTDAHGPKMSAEYGLAESLHVRDPFV